MAVIHHGTYRGREIFFSFLFFFSSPSYTPRDVVTWANIITILRDILRALAFKSPPSFLSLPVSLFPSFN